MRRKIFLLYPYYYPYYKAGGPVQSIYNLAGHFKEEVEFFFISLCRDIDNSDADIPVVCDSWQKGPQGENIYYTHSFSFNLIRRLMAETRPDAVFVNGLFNASTTIPGVFWAKWYGAKLIISPRGMLQSWALRQSRPLLKSIFIRFLKVLAGRNTLWHATDELERSDIQKFFGSSAVVHVASNIPRALIDLSALDFSPGKEPVRLVFLSLINPNKNLHLVINAVIQSQGKFILDIYGPVADDVYWKICERQIGANSNAGVNYKGSVVPWQVQGILKQYHFFVLPTQGENFGHAIFDALSSSVPVIISKNTPWKEIESKGAGFYMEEIKTGELELILNSILKLSQVNYQAYRVAAHNYAKEFWSAKHYSSEYQFLLGA